MNLSVRSVGGGVPLMALALLLVAGITGQAASAAGTTERVSVDSTGAEGNRQSTDPAISRRGRYVAFESDATNLVPGDTNNTGDIFVHDRMTGANERVNVSSDGAQTNPNGWSGQVAISADGRFVAFSSAAVTLIPDDVNDSDDVFVHDRVTGDTELVSVSSEGVQANSDCWDPSISADGRYVAFWSHSNHLVPGDKNRDFDVFVRDLQNQTTELVSVNANGRQGNAGSSYPAITPDGRYVAFDSSATNLVAGDTNDQGDVFLRDRVTGRSKRISVTTSGIQGNDGSFIPAISADGQYVAFWTRASNLVPGDTNDSFDVLIHDVVAGTTQLVSANTLGTQGNDHSDYATISANGRYVAFYSSASNLVSGDTNGMPDIFLRDLLTGKTLRMSVASDGSEANRNSTDATISADGNHVAFDSAASNLVSGDTNGQFDVFVRSR